MKTVKLNTILDLLAYYGEVFETDVEVGNRLIETIDDLLPFQGDWQRTHWQMITETGTYDQFIEATYNVLWDAACEDYDLINEQLGSYFKFGYNNTWSSVRWQSACHTFYKTTWQRMAMHFEIIAPFIGFEFRSFDITDGELCSTLQDATNMLVAKIKQIAKKLGKEVKFEND